MGGSLAAATGCAQMPEGQPSPCLFSHARAAGYPVTPLVIPCISGMLVGPITDHLGAGVLTCLLGRKELRVAHFSRSLRERAPPLAHRISPNALPFVACTSAR